MPVRALFVRAVNVGGTGGLPMAEFRALLEELGGSDVRTYVASGNAVADLPGSARSLERRVSDAIHARHGIRREVLVRTPAELHRARAAHPFPVRDPRHSYVCLLTATPSGSAVATAAAVPVGDDEWALAGGELHLRYAQGAGRATLDLARLLRALGVQGTARNLTTIEKVLALAEQ